MTRVMQKVRFVTLFSLITLLGCEESQETMVLKLAHILDSSHPVHLGMAHMGERLGELSNGTMRVDIYSGGQLGNERECLELVQLGALDMAKVASSVIENFVPAMAVFSLPYLFNDADHYWRVFDGEVGKEILLQGEPYLLRGLCYYDAGFRSFFVREKPVHSPEDLAGMKIRVMRSNLSIQTVNLLGGHATPMSYGELYSALQQGVVDGAENNPPNFYQSRFYEVSKFYSLDEHSAPPDVLVMGTHTWNKLTPRQQKWVNEAVAASVAYQKALWQQATVDALTAVEAAGVEVVRPDKRGFRESVSEIYAGLEGSELAPWIEKIRLLAPNEQVMPEGME